MFHVLQAGKQGLDALHMELGAMLCEAVMDMEREELSGPDYAPRHQGTYNGPIRTARYIVVIERYECATLG